MSGRANVRAGSFLAWTKADGRLMPVSIPMRFFAAAAVFHLLAWLALLAGAQTWPLSPSAPGWPLAALHLITLGVLVMTVMGAGTQLLPVATRQAAPPAWWLAIIWWLYTPGVAVLVLGMGLLRPWLLTAGALAVGLALLLWSAAMVRNLIGARGMPGVVFHGWCALASCLVALVSAGVLVAGWMGPLGDERFVALALHRVFAPYGLIGMLALGFSYILVPMFTLAETPSEGQQQAAGGSALAALLLAALGWPTLAALCAVAATAQHLRLMRRCAVGGLRRMAGPSNALVWLGWAGLLSSVLLAAAMPLWPDARLHAAFGLSLIGVWLLSYVLGLMQRIVPFLAAMHGSSISSGSGRRTPTPKALSHDGALRLHAICHAAALCLLAAAVGSGSAWAVRAAAVLGAVGAVAYGFFLVTVRRRMPAA